VGGPFRSPNQPLHLAGAALRLFQVQRLFSFGLPGEDEVSRMGGGKE